MVATPTAAVAAVAEPLPAVEAFLQEHIRLLLVTEEQAGYITVLALMEMIRASMD